MELAILVDCSSNTQSARGLDLSLVASSLVLVQTWTGCLLQVCLFCVDGNVSYRDDYVSATPDVTTALHCRQPDLLHKLTCNLASDSSLNPVSGPLCALFMVLATSRTNASRYCS